eukprot:364255-Chlamydomonas_euryale.AAC.8
MLLNCVRQGGGAAPAAARAVAAGQPECTHGSHCVSFKVARRALVRGLGGDRHKAPLPFSAIANDTAEASSRSSDCTHKEVGAAVPTAPLLTASSALPPFFATAVAGTPTLRYALPRCAARTLKNSNAAKSSLSRNERESEGARVAGRPFCGCAPPTPARLGPARPPPPRGSASPPATRAGALTSTRFHRPALGSTA